MIFVQWHAVYRRRWRCDLLLNKLHLVLLAGGESVYLKDRFNDASDMELSIRNEAARDSLQLKNLLNELYDCMSTMQVIVVNARIEASVLKSDSRQMTQISQSIECHANNILQDVVYCQARIREVE